MCIFLYGVFVVLSMRVSCVFSLSREWTVCEVEHNETPEETS